jgi:ATP-binding cassette subfamily C protein LapB
MSMQPASPQQQAQTKAAFAVVMRLAQLRREPLDGLAVRGVLEHCTADQPPTEIVEHLAQQLNLFAPSWLKQPDEGRLPMLALSPDGRWGVVTARNPEQEWAVIWWDGGTGQFVETFEHGFERGHRFARWSLAPRFVASRSPTFKLVVAEIFGQKRGLFDVATGTLAISLLALGTSFYSMQVYDRVVPTQAQSTLLVLSIGVTLAILFEMLGKWVRAHLLNRMTDAIDQRLARAVYSRFLTLRLDQLPPSVGTTSARLRSYETVRGFLVGIATQVIVDIPLALLALAVLAMIGGPIALIPAFFLVLGLTAGLVFHGRIERLAKMGTPTQHFKTGLLVESIEGAETIKSGQGGWRMLSRWLEATDQSRHYDLEMRTVSERSQHLVATLHQLAYVSIVAFGATQVGHSGLTMGGLIACSILAGRILTPITMVPNQVVQWAHAKTAVQDLDRLWALHQDHPPDARPLLLDRIQGRFELSEVRFNYPGALGLLVPSLQIRPGERIAVLGGVGSGKTTLLRVLAGMYKPQEGRITLDGVDLDLIAKSSLAARTGYVPQDGRLFAGTLRENLILGLTDPGDDAILAAAERTGLLEAVIAPDQRGLERTIAEGGTGLSGGQRQLVHVTRALLRQPSIWLLDEPTASMDHGLEVKVIQALQAELRAHPKHTLVLVTHKPQMLALVDRVIVFAQQRIVMDGPRDVVLQKLTEKPAPAGAAASAPAAAPAMAAGQPPTPRPAAGPAARGPAAATSASASVVRTSIAPDLPGLERRKAA